MGVNNLEFMQKQPFRDFASAVALGLVPGVSVNVKFGTIVAADADVTTDIWALGQTQPVYIFPDVAGEQIEVLSSSVADAGVPVLIQGLDANGIEQAETVTLTGTTPVAVPGLWTDASRVSTSGATRADGDVSVRGDGTTSTNIFAASLATNQQTTQAVYTVPSDKVAVMVNVSSAINVSSNQDSVATIKLVEQKPGSVFKTKIVYGLQQRGTSNISSDLIVPLVCAPGCRFKVQGTPDSAGTGLSAEFSMYLVDVDTLPADYVASL